MRCIYCNTPLAAIDYCTGCGADITIQKRIVRISNLLYNEGLEKALVRDMEGAIKCLKRSLKFNKENINSMITTFCRIVTTIFIACCVYCSFFWEHPKCVLTLHIQQILQLQVNLSPL